MHFNGHNAGACRRALWGLLLPIGGLVVVALAGCNSPPAQLSDSELALKAASDKAAEVKPGRTPDGFSKIEIQPSSDSSSVFIMGAHYPAITGKEMTLNFLVRRYDDPKDNTRSFWVAEPMVDVDQNTLSVLSKAASAPTADPDNSDDGPAEHPM